MKSSLMHLESIVAGSFCGSVVARINITFSGGSSRVLSSALKAPVESMCTSSMMYTFFRPMAGGYLTLSLSSLILSTPLLEAASISITSMKVPSLIAMQFAQCPQGRSPSDRQFTALARILAVVVLPVPLVPQKR